MKIKKILSLLIAMLFVAMIGVPAFAADDTGSGDGETPAAASDYDYSKDEKLSKASDPAKYRVGDFQWGGYSPAMYGILKNKMYTLEPVEKAVAIAEARKKAEKEAAAAKADENKPDEGEDAEEPEYTITFDDNEGSGGPGTQKVKGEETALSSVYPTRSGYTFAGWATEEDALAPTYVVGGTWKITTLQDVTLYAVWDDGTPGLLDETSANPKVEGVAVEAYYAFKCPKCGKALGGTSLLDIYNAAQGKCIHCEEYLPNPETLKIYRFIVINPDSAHFDALKNYDLAKASKDVYGATAGLYGDGKDLPQSDLVFGKDENGDEILTDFYTSGNHVEFKDSFMTGLFIFIVKFENFFTPLATAFSASAYNDIVWKIRVFLFGLIEKVLTFFATGI